MELKSLHEDRFLVQELRMGNAGAFEVLYRKYHARLFNFVKKSIRNNEDAAGIVQNVFLKVWEKRELLDEEQSFSGFLFRISKNIVYNEIRRSVREAALIEKGVESLDNIEVTTYDKTEFTELEACLKECLQKMPPRRREVFELSRYRGLTYREIAEALHISENTVDTQMRKALQFLKQNMEEQLYVSLLVSLFLF